MRKGDLVRRVAVSNVWVAGYTGWNIPFDSPLLVIRGSYESFVTWSDRAISVSIAIDVMDPTTNQVRRGEPMCDFVRFET